MLPTPNPMARILVLHAGRDGAAAALADRVAAGARTVRFAEATVRRLGVANESPDAPPAKHRPLDPSETLTSEDALVLVAGSAADVEALAEALRGMPADLVVGVAATVATVATDAWATLARAARPDAVLLPPNPDPEALGARAATVGGWVRHVRGHAHGESQGGGHSHAHGHHHH